MTRGVTLCNPCNLKTSDSFSWHGEVKPTNDPDHVLCQFDSMINGVRAATKLILNYNKIDGLTTIAQIISRFAPPDPDEDKNPTGAYIANVATWTDTGINDVIDFTSVFFMENLISAICRQEQGYNAIPPADLSQGVAEGLA